MLLKIRMSYIGLVKKHCKRVVMHHAQTLDFQGKEYKSGYGLLHG